MTPSENRAIAEKIVERLLYCGPGNEPGYRLAIKKGTCSDDEIDMGGHGRMSLLNIITTELNCELPRQETTLTEHFDTLLAILERHFCFSDRDTEREIMALRKTVLADREEAA